jgi:hypothetical protein
VRHRQYWDVAGPAAKTALEKSPGHIRSFWVALTFPGTNVLFVHNRAPYSTLELKLLAPGSREPQLPQQRGPVEVFVTGTFVSAGTAVGGDSKADRVGPVVTVLSLRVFGWRRRGSSFAAKQD